MLQLEWWKKEVGGRGDHKNRPGEIGGIGDVVGDKYHCGVRWRDQLPGIKNNGAVSKTRKERRPSKIPENGPWPAPGESPRKKEGKEGPGISGTLEKKIPRKNINRGEAWGSGNNLSRGGGGWEGFGAKEEGEKKQRKPWG